MSNVETIHHILELSVQAPSGENAQPWQFKIDGDRVFLFDLPERDQSLYNFAHRASYISHGAVIENMVIAASQYGLACTVQTFPDPQNPNVIAVIDFQKADIHNDPLSEYITQRCTNRKIYKDESIDPAVLAAIGNAMPAGVEGPKISFISDKHHVGEIATIASINDRLLLENKLIHDFFFQHVHWTLKEEEEKRSGFYIEVLELLPPAKALFKLFKNWNVMKIFNALGAAKKGAQENSKIYASAAAIGAITITDENSESFIKVGRVFQRLWLIATSKGISLQPLTGILFFHQRLKGGEGNNFSPAQKQLIEEAYAGLAKQFSIQGNAFITMMFRIGYADAPTAVSLKMPPNIIN